MCGRLVHKATEKVLRTRYIRSLEVLEKPPKEKKLLMHRRSVLWDEEGPRRSVCRTDDRLMWAGCSHYARLRGL